MASHSTAAVGYSEYSTTDLRGSKNSIGSWPVTPPPATLALLAVGGLGVLLRRRIPSASASLQPPEYAGVTPP